MFWVPRLSVFLLFCFDFGSAFIVFSPGNSFVLPTSSVLQLLIRYFAFGFLPFVRSASPLEIDAAQLTIL